MYIVIIIDKDKVHFLRIIIIILYKYNINNIQYMKYNNNLNHIIIIV